MASKRSRKIRQAKKQVPVNQETTLKIRSRVREGTLTFVLVSCAFFLAALFSYNSNDPSWSYTGTNTTVTNACGIVGAWLADICLYIVGYLAYLFPVLLVFAAINLYREKADSPQFYWRFFALKFTGLFILLAAGCGLADSQLPPNEAYLPYTSGGILGTVIANLVTNLLNPIGANLLLTGLLLTGITLFSGVSWLKLLDFLGGSLLLLTRLTYRQTKKGVQSFSLKKSTQNSDEPPFEQTIDVAAEEVITEQEQIEREAKRKLPRQWLKRSEPSLIVEPEVQETEVVQQPEPAIQNTMSIADSTVEFKTAELTPKAGPNSALKLPKLYRNPNQVSKAAPGEAKIPPLSLLDPPNIQTHKSYTHATLEAMSREVELRLYDFGVQAKVVAVHPGPVITRFEIQPAPGTKVSKISSLAKDLARSLSVTSVRVVEVIPGKSFVGLEVPNNDRQVVKLSEILSSSAYQQMRSPLSISLGKDIAGHPVIVDLGKMPHLLVAGTTGSGKSVGLNAMILSLLYKATPEHVRLIMIDPKMLELSVYEGIPHLLCPVVTDMKDAANALRWSVAEMEKRYRLMAALGVRNLQGYNQKIAQAQAQGESIKNPLATTPADSELTALPYIVVIIDEFADMMMVVGKKVEELIARIAQKARAAGIHMILATQRPSVDVITGLIKANIPTRIAFQVSSKVDSRTILDQHGAEQLLGQGDLLYLAPGSGIPVRVHGAYISDEEVHRVANELREQAEPDYCPEILNQELSLSPTGAMLFDDVEDPESDPFYDKAVEIVLSTRRASISGVQRRLKIGYNRAARLVEAMEKAGLVGPMESNGNREILVPAPLDEA